MATRVPLAVNMQSRDGTVTKDAKVLNGIIESNNDPNAPVLRVRKRPGSADLGLVQAGIAQLLYYWNGINTIQADKLSRGTIATIISGPTQTSLSPTNASQMFSASDTGANAATSYLMFHNKTQAWSVTVGGTVAAITLPAAIGLKTFSIPSLTRVSTTATGTLTVDPVFGPGTVITIAGATPSAYNGAQTVLTTTNGSAAPVIAVTLTRSGTTATATTVSGPHGFSNGATVTISGANESAYDGAVAITVTGTTTFTYTVSVTTFAAITGTWNPADKDVGVTLSGSNLIASFTAAMTGVRGTVSKSASQWAWEVTINTAATDLSIGVATSGFSLSSDPFASTVAWVYEAFGRIWHNSSIVATVSSFTNGDVIGVKFDGDADAVGFFKNGVLQGGYISGLSGTYFPLASNRPGGGTASVTANFAGAFTYSYDDPASPGTGTIIATGSATPASFTFTIGGSPTTPATGTITATYSTNLVPGVAYIDGYFNIMDENGVVYQSASDNPTSWPALTFFTAQNETGAGVCIAKSLNWLVAFKEWSTEFFYDAKNPAPGSPFSPVDNGFTQIGCASGDSVRQLDGNLFWLSQTRQRGRGVYVMNGLQQQEVSTPDVARILNADNLATVYALGLKLDGHVIYLLTLVTSNITLAYDMTSKTWGQWSSLTLGTAISVKSITLSGSIATVTTSPEHGLPDGDPVSISGADQSNYNGIFPATYLTTRTFTIPVNSNTVTPATPGPTYATLNPADKGANVTLSNGNLTASVASGSFGMVRATQGKSSGKWYWEVTIGTMPALVGIADSTAALGGFLGQDAHGWAYYSGGTKYTNAVPVAYGATYTNADKIGVALDMDAGTITFYKNGVSQGVAFSGLSGTLFPAWGAESSATEAATVNFGATPFAYAPPVGYNTGIFTNTITATPYTESYFKYTKYADCGGLDLVLHETNGHLYQILPTLRQDAGIPINTFTRTIRLDGGTTELKAMSQAIVIADQVSDIVMMRWSDNDSATFSAYRPVDLSLEQPKLRRSAQFRRRTIETKHIGNNPLRLEALELEIVND